MVKVKIKKGQIESGFYKFLCVVLLILISVVGYKYYTFLNYYESGNVGQCVGSALNAKCVDIAKKDYGFKNNEELKIRCDHTWVHNIADCYCSQWTRREKVFVEHDSSYELMVVEDPLLLESSSSETYRFLTGEGDLLKVVYFNLKESEKVPIDG